MDKYKDALGSVSLPADVLERLRSYVAPEPAPVGDVEFFEPDDEITWHVVKTIPGSNGKSVHTVQQFGNTDKLKCSCHAFRIQKTGHCKHTVAVAEELGL